MERQGLLIELGRRLRSARLRAELSVSDLARKADVSRRHVTEAEAGRANLSVVKISALASALDVPLRALFDFDLVLHGRIALVGLRGAGKSTIGRRLALGLEAPFVELDQRVEEIAGLPLASIFEMHGSDGFRRLEAEALEKVLAEGGSLVLATGGSIVTSPATFARLRQTCHTVWLKARPEDHFARVAAQGDQRPMLGRPRALEELNALLRARVGSYSRCEITIDTSEASVDQVVAALQRRFTA